MASTTSASRTWLILISFVGWIALIGQFYLIVSNRTASIPETVIRYFSFFTILTNILVAVCSTVLLLRRPSGLFHFFSRPSTETALLVYITIVGIVYNVVLRVLWDPQGFAKVVDELLHTIIPLLYIIYWSAFINKKSLHWTSIPGWLIYPAAYAVYTLIRGAYFHWYPYPFVDVNTLGYRQVFINSGVLVLLFLFFSIVIVGAAKIISSIHTSKKISTL